VSALHKSNDTPGCLLARGFEQIADLYQYIASEASPSIALRYTEAIVSYCESLSIFPQRGMKRDDVRAGLRITHYKKRAVIDFCGRCRVGIHLGHLLRRAAL